MSYSRAVVNRPGQGEAIAVWTLWAATTVAVVVTYARIEPGELYNVSRDGIDGGLSRALVHVNYPIALVAIALVLVAMGALKRRAWWAGGPAIALCATTPLVVEQADLDARWVNLVPAAGVAVAVGLTVAASPYSRHVVPATPSGGPVPSHRRRRRPRALASVALRTRGLLVSG